MDKEYYIGLDIGTNSVGWAVTDPEYNLCRFRKKDMWGIRLFESAESAAERRSKRTGRRRLYRRNQRLRYLQALFAEEVHKIDPAFFIRLNDSKLHMEDKSLQEKHVLFADPAYSDLEYYEEYPTIFHLRKALIENTAKQDVRFVYLALHHIIKYRGHFLVPGDLNAAKDFGNTFEAMVQSLHDQIGTEFYVSDKTEFENLLKDQKLANSEKAKELTKLVDVSGETDDKVEQKRQKDAVKEICKLMTGNQGDLRKIFGENLGLEKNEEKVKFSESKYDEETSLVLEEKIPEEYFVLREIKALYDWSVLVDILGDQDFYSFAKVGLYDRHGKNLRILKKILKKYLDKEAYKTFFDGRKGSDNYSNYVGSVKTNGKKYKVKHCTEDAFYQHLGKVLDGIKPNIEEADMESFAYLALETERHSLLPLQRSKANGVVPKQVHEAELNAILHNAETYLPFLHEKQEDGLTIAEKIRAIFNFRIPYYVGPLSDRHRKQGSNSWMVRREDGYIYPWNMERKVDLQQSNERFIRRMTNKCTYLIGEDVLPRNSLLYSRYMVLNELNNLKVRGRGISEKQKQDIFCDLFMKHGKVTGKMLLKYLQKDDSELTLEMLSGFDVDFKASMSSYLDFEKNVFGERMAEDRIRAIAEDIIKWATIYGDDGNMLASVIEHAYPGELSEEQIKAVKRLRYSGWGNFSRKFLTGIEGIDSATGEQFNLIDALWETNNNLMQLLSGSFTFKRELDLMNAEKIGEVSSISYETLVKDLFTSPANKRAIWQTIQIVEEIRKIMGCEPQKIFVEMARGGDQVKQRTKSRKQHLQELYEKCDADMREWALADIDGRDEREFNSMKLYLYYTQMGRCAYTGERIDIGQLMVRNSRWDRDHIYPQSRIKDDSIDNLVLVRKDVNAKKDNELIGKDIQKKMLPTWKAWLKQGFISKKKFDRLMRTDDFTDSELAGFINRQLVETRQSTKIVAELLDHIYQDAKIVRTKAGWVSDFRKEPLKVLKSRRINDFHHAKDAYLNIVAGNVYSTRFTDNPVEWMKKHRNENWSINKVFYFDVDGAWAAPDKERGSDGKHHYVQNEAGEVIGGTIDKVRRIVKQNNILYTEYTYCGKGQLFDETIQAKEKATNIPLKKGLDTGKYGGYASAKTSYFALIEFDGKKGKRVRNFVGVPIYIANMLPRNPEAFAEYCTNVLGKTNVTIVKPIMKKNALMVVNGFPMRIRGENEKNIMLKSNMQLILADADSETIRKIEKWKEKKAGKGVVAKYDGFDASDLLALYDVLTEKLTQEQYQGRPSNQHANLLKGRERFIELNMEQQAILIDNLLTQFRCDIETKSDLTMIGGSKNAGAIVINKNTLGSSDVRLIDQSITGLYVKKEQL